jgi:hypothetical protein
MNLCGACSLCCKLLDIAALAKPANLWCESCAPGLGCKIYEKRPDACKSFSCVWLTTRRQPGANPLPDDLRPDRCKGLLMLKAGAEPPMACHLDPANPDAWREGALGEFLRFMAQKTRIVVKSGRRLITLDSDGAYEARIIGAYGSAPTAIDVKKTAKYRIEW